MEEKKRSLSVNALNYGLITGGVMIVFNLILFISNLYMNQSLGYIGYLFMLGGMVWGTLEYRKKLQNGFMTYGEAFLSCFLIGLFAGILGVIYTVIYTKFINPGFINEIVEQARIKMQAKNNLTEDQIETALDYTRKFTTPLWFAILGLLASAFMSLILGLLAAIFLKKVDPSAPKSAL
jgi:hypothetical protein